MDQRTQPPAYEQGQDIRDRAFDFACCVVNFCQKLYDAGGVSRMMVPQLLDCSTSVPSMLEEARAAESRRDFISKCYIGLKECRESWTRLRICVTCRLGPQQEGASLAKEAGELVAIIGAIVRNTRRNAPLPPPRRRRVQSRMEGQSRIPNS